MRFYGLTLGILGVWRVTHLLAVEDGPWNAIVRVRRRLGDGVWGQLLNCFYCVSVWVAAPFAGLLHESIKEWLLLWLALSGGAVLLERATQPSVPRKSHEPRYWEEDANVVLRQGSSAVTPNNSIDG